VDLSFGATVQPTTGIRSDFGTGDVAKGGNEIQMNQIIQKNEGGRRGRAAGCASVVQSCSGASGLCGDRDATMWR